MVKRSRAEFLGSNLPQLQNLIRRDPSSYKDEFLMQWRQWESGMKIFGFKPDEERLEFAELITFISHVCYCYPSETKEFPTQLMDLLTKHQTILAPSLRKSMVQALILLRNKGIVPAMTLMPLFFSLFRVPDKDLRKLLHTHIVSDVKNANAKAKNNRMNKSLQNYMYKMLHDPSETAARKSLDVMIDLYRKNVWNDAKTVNVISEACFSEKPKIVSTALRFFLDSNSTKDKDEEDDDLPDINALKHKAQINKKKSSTKSEVEKALASVRRKERQRSRAEVFNFSALHLINDPQGFAERLFQRLKSATANTTFRFELRLQIMDLVTRLIGVHKLIVLPLYDFVIPYLKPHQREAASILAYMAQASHELVPPDTMEAVVQAIADNFVWSNAAAEVVAAGLNSLREICTRCPLAMTETLLQSLMEDYKNNREKSTMNAGRSLLSLFREVNPLMLKKRDRGKGASVNLKEFHAAKYGEVTVHETLEGLDLFSAKPTSDSEDEYGSDFGSSDDEGSEAPELTESTSKKAAKKSKAHEEEAEAEGDGWEGWEEASLDSEDEEDGSGGEWEDVEASEGEGEDLDEEVGEGASDEEDDSGEEEGDLEESPRKKRKQVQEKIIGPKQAKYMEKMGRLAKSTEMSEEAALEAKALATSKIFTDEEFARMKELATQRKAEKMAGSRPGSLGNNDVEDESDDENDPTIVDVHRITSGVKRKMTYDERIESIQAGREGRQKFGSKMGQKKDEKGASTTNREKEKKTKNFMMIVHKRTIKGKAKRSLREKQKILRAHITKQKKKGH
ncbi:Protein SDA1 [Dinochytrium kinnereticum]|nr:Protein SDA1 [Dinochytrium kinnereticum]